MEILKPILGREHLQVAVLRGRIEAIRERDLTAVVRSRAAKFPCLTVNEIAKGWTEVLSYFDFAVGGLDSILGAS